MFQSSADQATVDLSRRILPARKSDELHEGLTAFAEKQQPDWL
jgi:hypothetical protein